MGVTIAPRIDPRLRRRIFRDADRATAAEMTRQVGALAWQLGLPRPSYQQVRIIRSYALLSAAPAKGSPTIDAKVVFHMIGRALFWAADYPGLGLGRNYRRAYPKRM